MQRKPWSRHGSCWRGARGRGRSGGSGSFPRPLPCDVPVLMLLVLQQSFVEFPQARDGRFGPDGQLHTRRRFWQWHALCGLAGYDAPRVVFSSGVARPRMLCIMAVMDQKDSALVVNHGSGMCSVGFPGDSAPRAVFLAMLGPQWYMFASFFVLVEFLGFFHVKKVDSDHVVASLWARIALSLSVAGLFVFIAVCDPFLVFGYVYVGTDCAVTLRGCTFVFIAVCVTRPSFLTVTCSWRHLRSSRSGFPGRRLPELFPY